MLLVPADADLLQIGRLLISMFMLSRCMSCRTLVTLCNGFQHILETCRNKSSNQSHQEKKKASQNDPPPHDHNIRVDSPIPSNPHCIVFP